MQAQSQLVASVPAAVVGLVVGLVWIQNLPQSVSLRGVAGPSMRCSRVSGDPEKRTFHSFRHTFAKRALESGTQIPGFPVTLVISP